MRSYACEIILSLIAVARSIILRGSISESEFPELSVLSKSFNQCRLKYRADDVRAALTRCHSVTFRTFARKLVVSLTENTKRNVYFPSSCGTRHGCWSLCTVRPHARPRALRLHGVASRGKSHQLSWPFACLCTQSIGSATAA